MTILKTLFALALLLCLAPSARAQDFLPYPGGVTLVTRDFDPARPGESILKPIFGDPKLLRQVVNTAWQGARAPIADQIKAQMGRANSVARGVTPYNIVCNMGQPGDLSVQPGSYANGSTLQMKYVVRGNWIEFDTTQPTAAGKWADPRFSCTYDLTLTLSMSLGHTPGPLHMTSVKAAVSNSKLDSHGLIADLVFIGNAVAKLFGENFIKRAQNAIDGKNFDFTQKLNGALAPFNAMLANMVGQGYALANSLLNAPENALPGGLRPASLPGATPQGPQLVLFLDSDGKIPTRGTGEIAGAIRWKKALGTPQRQAIAPGAKSLRTRNRHAFARGFRISAIAQSGFGQAGMFTPPMTEVGVLKSVTLDEAASRGDEYVLRYVIDQLPLNIPIKVQAGLSAVPWDGEISAGQSRGIGPSNWAGVITLKPGRPLVITTPAGGISAMGAASAGASAPGTQQGIIIVSGKRSRVVTPSRTTASSGGDVALNPQPLPPRPNPGDPVMATRSGSARSRRTPSVRTTPGGIDLSAIESASAIRAQMPREPLQNPTGTLAVGNIDFEMGLVTGPR